MNALAMFFTLLLHFLLFFSCVVASAPKGLWDKFNLAPHSRTVRPQSIRSVHGSVEGVHNILSTSDVSVVLSSNSWLTLDFGFEVGGLISMNVDGIDKESSLSLSFTESPLFISPFYSDDSRTSSSTTSSDGVLRVGPLLSPGHWTQTPGSLRGGFRFLTIASNSRSPVAISNVSCNISFMPHVEDLRDYSGYFYALDPVFHDEDFLTKIWYSGAYTIQTNTLSVNTGRQVSVASSPGWANNATIGVAGPLIVDGAKRDRTVWPGDLGISVPTAFVSTNDMLSARNSLSTMYSTMDPVTGELAYAGPPLNLKVGSDTYHAWTLVGTYTYFLYTGDVQWLQDTWGNYTKAVGFLTNKIDASGLMNVTGVNDWGRLGGGGYGAAANALLYRVYVTGSEIASYLNDTALSHQWFLSAAALKERYNEVLWVPDLGMYRDNETTTLCPEDANSLAVLFNLTTSSSQTASISEGLVKNWNDLGAVTPELPDTIAPFVSGFEIQAHFASGNDARAMELLRREWGYMLYTNISVQSTLLEGYTTNGSLYYRSYDGYNYDPSYTSHAHGWSTGPTSALTFYVLGLTVTAPRGEAWSVAPHLAGLSAAEGGFETPLGWFGVKWAFDGNRFTLQIDTPEGTNGVVALPIKGSLSLDSKVIDAQAPTASGSISVKGGKHNVSVVLE